MLVKFKNLLHERFMPNMVTETHVCDFGATEGEESVMPRPRAHAHRQTSETKRDLFKSATGMFPISTLTGSLWLQINVNMVVFNTLVRLSRLTRASFACPPAVCAE